MTYQNPILHGCNPDPSICRVGEDFYLATSTLEFFPGVPIYHSKNLVNWELINYCLATDSQAPLFHASASEGIYAPTLRYRDGVFFMVTTNVTAGFNFIVHTNDIHGRWSEPVRVSQGGIDPSLFWDDDGVCYLVSNGSADPSDGRGIFLCEIDPFTGEAHTASRRISGGCGARCAEAPHIYKRDGWYYLLLAEGGTEYGHMATLQRSREIYGPYEACPHNPILSHRDRADSPIQAVGHADFVDDENGNWWLVCLGIRPIPRTMLHHIGRETFLAPLTWGADGWPTAGRNGTVDLEMEGPLPGPAPHRENLDFEDRFEEEDLHLRWNFVRNPKRECYRLERGRLVLVGAQDDLSTPCGHPTMIAVHQQAFCMEVTAELEGEVCLGGCAGLSAFYNSDYHYDVLVTREADGCYVCLRKRVADIDVIVERHPIDYQGSVRFRIESDEKQYVFSYETGADFVELGRGRTALLCTEGTYPMSFTGTYWGVFSEKGEMAVTRVAVRELQ